MAWGTGHRRDSRRNGALSHYVALVAPAKYVFDAGQKCLLGIMIRKIYVPANSEDPESREKDIAKYFVPASTIRGFIPN